MCKRTRISIFVFHSLRKITMRKIITMLLTILPLLAYAQQSETIQLNEGWQFSKMNSDQWYDADVPGSVQRDLVSHGVLPDPFYGTNEEQLQWVEDVNWDFKKTFNLSAAQLQHDEALLQFEGLDTHADVFLNGSRILRTQNMFIGYEVRVKELLIEGENNLYIRFHSPIEAMMPARDSFGYDYPAGNDHREEKLSIYSRKAPYHFGWDWGIRIVQMGIWKPVSLLLYNDARIEDYYVKQQLVTEEKAEIEHQLTIHALTKGDATLSYGYALNGKVLNSEQKEVHLTEGMNNLSIPTTISNPQRWMPVNWGEQHLYDFFVTVTRGDHLIAEKHLRTGLRTVRLVQEPDEHGRSFYFEVNGIPLFAKGANYIPGEIFTTQQDEAYYKNIFDQITDANMNFVRVWGGGIYENEEFYRQADERGILIWQDFIFACAPYPSDDLFLASVREEAIYNIKRLRNHPSLAFWCGNNEINEALNYWGWDKQYPTEVMQTWQEGYDKTFRQLLPSLVEEYDGTRSYIHGSPYDANWGNTEKFASSDVHDWGLWYGHLPFEAMADRLPRFASEFGFQSFPEMKTIRSFALEEQWALESEVMQVHQKATTGNSLIKKYMEMYFPEPKSFEDFVYMGLAMQGNGMEESVEAMRRGRPYCMGALYWQINDDWPVVSWSSIDYYGNWKAQHYKMRNVLAPLALGVDEKEGMLHYYTLSDYLTERTDLTLTVQVIDFTKGIQKEFRERVNATANASTIVKSYKLSDLLKEDEKAHTMLHAFLTDSNGEVISRKEHFFYWPNRLELPQTTVESSVEYADGEYRVTLFSEKLAKDLFLEIPVQGARFSDNFINLLPGEQRTIIIRSPQLKAAERTAVTVKHMRETY